MLKELFQEGLDLTVPLIEQPAVVEIDMRVKEAKRLVDTLTAQVTRYMNVTDPHRQLNLEQMPSPEEVLIAKAELPAAQVALSRAALAYRQLLEEQRRTVQDLRAFILARRKAGLRPVVQRLDDAIQDAVEANSDVNLYLAETRTLTSHPAVASIPAPELLIAWHELTTDPQRDGGRPEQWRRSMRAEGLLECWP